MITPGRTDERTKSLAVCLVVRAEPGTTGTSRYVEQISRGLQALDVRQIKLATQARGPAARVLSATRFTGADLVTFLAQYPAWLRWPKADVYHLTVQTYASALVFRRPPGPAIVTVHDIIPYLVRHQPGLNSYGHLAHRLFDWLAMKGLERADHLIADSSWTKRTMVAELGIEPSRITVVPLGVDRNYYRPFPVPPSFRTHYALAQGPRYILYVGSEDRRKNLDALWRGFAQIRRKDSNVQLLKVGAGYEAAERRRLLQLASELAISTSIHFFDHVPDGDLPYFYNVASVVVMPSLYEGFGLPVLEALACGTPVVCANTSALPEIAGGGVLFCEPTADGIGDCLQQALADGSAHRARTRTSQAAKFSWEATARQVNHVYRRAIGS